MKFSEFKYKRPNYEENKKEILELIQKINDSQDYNEQKKNIDILNKLRNNIETMSTLCSIRNSINTQDKFYEKEKSYWDEYSPLYEELNSDFYNAIINSKFKNNIENDLGSQFLKICEFNIKSFSSEIIKDLQEENRLCSEYTKLLASAKIEFNGEVMNLSSISKFMSCKDRNIRIESSKAYYKFFEENEFRFDDIFDKLVKIRDNIAKKLNFNNFVELGYIRMMRTDYNSQMVKKFRKQVLDYIVPIASSLYKRQEMRLKIDKLSYIDENLEFLSGNAIPKGSEKYIIQNGRKMYSKLSKETKEFFEFMLKNELMDLVTKKGKSAGGYCTYIPDFKAPFIFSNFNNTSDDIDVLTHEAGHAFQLYMSSWINMPEINFPTYESCEIHSMSMEFITWPYMDLFFKEDTNKYKFTHLSSAIKFIPYGIVVDEFQHKIYENPSLDKEQRKTIWRELEKIYLPHKNYEDNEFLEKGTWWFKQGHIFKNPFYYIDYTLAQICALQFWKKMSEDKTAGWNSYLDICKVGGTKSFLEIVNIGNLKSPFEDGCVESIIGVIKDWLNEIDDTNL